MLNQSDDMVGRKLSETTEVWVYSTPSRTQKTLKTDNESGKCWLWALIIGPSLIRRFLGWRVGYHTQIWRAPSVFTVSDLTVNQKQFRGLACGWLRKELSYPLHQGHFKPTLCSTTYSVASCKIRIMHSTKEFLHLKSSLIFLCAASIPHSASGKTFVNSRIGNMLLNSLK